MALINNDYTKDFIDTVYRYFCNNIYDISQYLSYENIHFCDNLNEDIKMFYNSTSNIFHKCATILPNEIIEKVHILLDISIENDDNSNIVALFHEFIHISDFAEYAKLYNQDDLEGINNLDSFKAYKTISEFRAYSKAEIYMLELQGEEFIQQYQEVARSNEERFLLNYTQQFFQKLTEGRADMDSICAFLAKFYFYDYFEQRSLFDDSCIHRYIDCLDELSHRFLLQLYQLYVSGLDNPFGVLDQVQHLLGY